MYPSLKNFHWRAVKAHFGWYAKATIHRDGKQFDIAMHRFIARTKLPQVTHHINGDTLDNRRENLQNMDKIDHKLHHANNRILRKFGCPHLSG